MPLRCCRFVYALFYACRDDARALMPAAAPPIFRCCLLPPPPLRFYADIVALIDDFAICFIELIFIALCLCHYFI